MQLPEALQIYVTRCQQQLAACLPTGNDIVHQAMRYSVLGGGKRLRPLLVYAAGSCSQAPLELLDRAAVAVECIHAYSLIHDDLPAMDNAVLRHGQPACHRQFGEAMAILAGDALQSLAFAVLAENGHPRQIKLLAQAIGAEGMVLGQSLDMQAGHTSSQLDHVRYLHQCKTGALIKASVQLGILCSDNYSPVSYRLLSQFADYLGLAFQIQDDILDIEVSTQQLGKAQGQDSRAGKATYPQLLGLAGAKSMLAETFAQARACLQEMPEAALMEELLRVIEQRQW